MNAGDAVDEQQPRPGDPHPDLVSDLGPNATAATAPEAALAGDVVVVTIPLKNYRSVPVEELRGKVVIDTMNYYPGRDGDFPELDDESTTTSELLQAYLPESRVVKAFNNIFFQHLAALPGRPTRPGPGHSGDDAGAKALVTTLLDRIGYDTPGPRRFGGGLARPTRHRRVRRHVRRRTRQLTARAGPTPTAELAQCAASGSGTATASPASVHSSGGRFIQPAYHISRPARRRELSVSSSRTGASAHHHRRVRTGDGWPPPKVVNSTPRGVPETEEGLLTHADRDPLEEETQGFYPRVITTARSSSTTGPAAVPETRAKLPSVPEWAGDGSARCGSSRSVWWRWS